MLMVKRKGEVIPVMGRGGPCGCETSMLPHFLNSRLTDDVEFVTLTRRPPFALRNVCLNQLRCHMPACRWTLLKLI
jgi:hypothetical protein